jgi:hypothetical protein
MRHCAVPPGLGQNLEADTLALKRWSKLFRSCRPVVADPLQLGEGGSLPL